MSPIPLAGAALHPDPSGAVWWEAERTLAVADLHLEKGSSFARRGVFLPPYDSAETLSRLEALARRYGPKRILCLGDNFHDANGPARLSADVRARLDALASAHELVWITGNHEGRALAGVPGCWADCVRMGPLVFRHEPTGQEDGEVAGHLHPCATLVHRGRAFRRRCFAGDGRCAVLPAFGAFTGGLDLDDAAFAALFRAPPRVWLCAGARVYPLPRLKRRG